MQPQNPPSIAYDSGRERSGTNGRFSPATARRTAGLLAAAGLGAGTAAAVYYGSIGLALSHYDAKAHLVVARRIFDSLTPGWQQIGAVWLPLPHLLNAVPVQLDVLYRTGASGTAMSVVGFALMVWALSRFILAATGSAVGATLGVLVLVMSPDLLYLTATPMTEPLSLGLSALALWLTASSLEAPTSARTRHAAGAAMALACLVRYEAWPVAAALVALSVVARLLAGASVGTSLRHAATMAAYPAGAVLLFTGLSRATVGEWVVTSGFFVPETLTRGRPARSFVAVWWGAHQITGYPLAILGTLGLLAAMAAAATRRVSRAKPALLLAGALAAAGALPWYAFYAGHPFRYRYMVPLVPAVALGLGLLVGLTGRRRSIAAAIAVAVVALGPHPFDPEAPMVLESQLDSANRTGRRAVTRYLDRHWDGEPVLASMGALAHYMQELAEIGFSIRDFVHEGNGAIWAAAVSAPVQHVQWILVEEHAEGGDQFAVRIRSDPAYLDGFDRVAEGGNVALYRRAAPVAKPRSASGSPKGR